MASRWKQPGSWATRSAAHSTLRSSRVFSKFAHSGRECPVIKERKRQDQPLRRLGRVHVNSATNLNSVTNFECGVAVDPHPFRPNRSSRCSRKSEVHTSELQ